VKEVMNESGCPILVAFFATEPALSEAEGMREFDFAWTRAKSSLDIYGFSYQGTASVVPINGQQRQTRRYSATT